MLLVGRQLASFIPDPWVMQSLFAEFNAGLTLEWLPNGLRGTYSVRLGATPHARRIAVIIVSIVDKVPHFVLKLEATSCMRDFFKA